MSFRGTVVRTLQKAPPLYRVAAAAAHPTRKGQRPSAVARAVKYEVVTRRMGRPITVPLGERSKLLAYPGETNTPKAVVANPPNFPDMLVWRRYLRPGDLFVDVGANIGAYTIWAAECGAEVIAVEPNRHNAGRVREHLDLNGYAAEVLNIALSDAPGIVHITENMDSLNHLTSDQSGVEVEARTLDDVIGDRTAAVKIDVEGAERLVLAGASRALKEHRLSLVQLEWEIDTHMGIGSRDEVAALLSDAGYALYVADNHGVLHPLPDPDGSYLNVFAMPTLS